MKRYWFTSLLLLFVILMSLAQSRDEGQRVQEIAKKKFQWLISRRIDSLEVVLDDRLKYIHSNGMTQSKKDVIEELKSGKLTYQSIDVRDLEVRVYEGAAIVTGKGKFTGVGNGNSFAVDLLFTEVYVWKDKAWRLASRHASKLP